MAAAGTREFEEDTCLMPPQGVLSDPERSIASPTAMPQVKHPTSVRDALDVTLDVRIVLGGTRISLADVRRLEIGSILLLDRGVSEPVDVLVNQNLVARGELFVLDGRYCVKISETIQGPTPPANKGTQAVPDSQQA